VNGTHQLPVYAGDSNFNKRQKRKNKYRKGITDTLLDANKGKSIPVQVLTGPEGSRRFRLPDFKTIGT
jgi:hypothetical protein